MLPPNLETLESRLLNSAGAADLIHDVVPLPSNPATTASADLGAAAVADGRAVFYFGNAQGTADVYDSAQKLFLTTQVPDPGIPVVAASARGTLVFAELGKGGAPASRVEVFDVARGRWTRSSLRRSGIWTSGAGAAEQVVFVTRDPKLQVRSFVEFFNPVTHTSAVHALPIGAAPTAVLKVGTKLLFIQPAGKIYTYDTLSKSWSSISPLDSSPSSVVAVGTRVVFFSGDSATIYDSVAGTSHITTIGQSRDAIAGTALGTKAIFAGGSIAGNSAATYSAEADVYDVATDTWSATSLAAPRFGIIPATVGSTAIFAEGGVTNGTSFSILPFNQADLFTDTSPAAVLSGGLAGAIGHRDKVTVINTGDAALPAGYTIQLYATTDRTLSGAILVGSLNVHNALAAAASSSPFSVRTVIPKGTPGGTYHLLAAVQDAAGHITPIAAEEAVFKVKGATARPSNSRAPLAAVPAVRSPFANTRIQRVGR